METAFAETGDIFEDAGSDGMRTQTSRGARRCRHAFRAELFVELIGGFGYSVRGQQQTVAGSQREAPFFVLSVTKESQHRAAFGQQDRRIAARHDRRAMAGIFEPPHQSVSADHTKKV